MKIKGHGQRENCTMLVSKKTLRILFCTVALSSFGPSSTTPESEAIDRQTAALKEIEATRLAQEKQLKLVAEAKAANAKAHKADMDRKSREDIAAADRKSQEENFKRFLKPQTFLGVTSIGIGIIAFFFAAKTAYDYYKKQSGMPEIIIKTNYRKSIEDEEAPSELYASERVKNRIETITQKLDEAINSNSDVFNLLFFGPPGTGKTLAINRIAYTLRENLVYFFTSGSRYLALAERKDGSAIAELNKMYKLAERVAQQGKKVMIFVDEAESLFAKRLNAKNTKEQGDLLKEFLALCDKPSHPNIMWAIATNIPSEIDSAVLSRFSKSNWVRVDLPDEQARKDMIEYHIERIIKKRTQSPVSLDGNFDAAHYAKLTHGYAGRDLEDLCREMVSNAAISDKVVTHQIALDTINQAQQSAEDVLDFAQNSDWATVS